MMNFFKKKVLNKMQKHNDCIFCKIINEEINSLVIASNDKALAFLDINPISVGHVIIIPKAHFLDLSTTPDEYLFSVFKLAKFVVNMFQKSSLDPWGFNYLSNQGHIAGQVINHFHLHIIPKYAKKEGFELDLSNIYIDHKIEDVHKQLLKSIKKINKDKYNK